VRIVQVLGKEKAIEIFEKTKEIEETGGLLIMVINIVKIDNSYRN
jgi:hypothetical protein